MNLGSKISMRKLYSIESKIRVEIILYTKFQSCIYIYNDFSHKDMLHYARIQNLKVSNKEY